MMYSIYKKMDELEAELAPTFLIFPGRKGLPKNLKAGRSFASPAGIQVLYIKFRSPPHRSIRPHKARKTQKGIHPCGLMFPEDSLPGLIREITWKRGEIRGNMLTRQPPYIGRMAKNFSPSNDILRLIYSRFVQLAKKTGFEIYTFSLFTSMFSSCTERRSAKKYKE